MSHQAQNLEARLRVRTTVPARRQQRTTVLVAGYRQKGMPSVHFIVIL